MADFNSQLERMKSLMTYGKINENADSSNNCSLELHKEAADGKTYGIIKEFNKYYIKQASEGKELMAEAYNYIGGYMNKKNYEYTSYNNALKNFELKLQSINEAQDCKVNIETLDPFRREDVLVEGTQKMRDEIARQRQIMHNAAMIMNESKDYAVKGDGCMCNTKQPEAPTGKKGDEGGKEAKVVDQDNVNGTNGLEKKAEPFTSNPIKAPKDTLKESCCCGKKDCCECGGKVNEEASATDTDFDDGVDTGLHSEIGDGDPFEMKQTVEDSVLSEEASATDTDFDEGLPSNAEAGVGEPDTDHNNNPFKEDTKDELNEEDEFNVEDGDDFDDEDGFDLFGDDEDDFDVEDGEGDDVNADVDVDVTTDDTVDDAENSVDSDVDETDPESIKAEIERLQSLLDDIEGTDDVDGEDGDVEASVTVDGEDFGNGEEGSEGVEVDINDDDFPVEDDFEDITGDLDEEFDECGDGMFECTKEGLMESIVRDVTDSILNEDELHDFGKHAGYRKKPFELPETGQDRNQWGRDWNDESVHSEEPFGKQIGDSAPFDQLVNAVTKEVMYQLKKGVPLDNKKKH